MAQIFASNGVIHSMIVHDRPHSLHKDQWDTSSKRLVIQNKFSTIQNVGTFYNA